MVLISFLVVESMYPRSGLCPWCDRCRCKFVGSIPIAPVTRWCVSILLGFCCGVSMVGVLRKNAKVGVFSGSALGWFRVYCLFVYVRPPCMVTPGASVVISWKKFFVSVGIMLVVSIIHR